MADHEIPSGPPLGGGVRTNMPLYAFGSIALFVVAVVVLIITNHAADSVLFIGLCISTIPSLVAALFSERSARDIRNGLVEEKVRRGTHTAIQESGVVTRGGPVALAQLESINELLEGNRRILREIKGGNSNDG